MGAAVIAEVAHRFTLPRDAQITPDVADAFGEQVLLLRLNDRGEPAFRMSADHHTSAIHAFEDAHYREQHARKRCHQLVAIGPQHAVARYGHGGLDIDDTQTAFGVGQ